MSDELELIAPQFHMLVETVDAPVAPELLSGVTIEAPNAEQVRASEAYFTRSQREASEVAGVLGLWTGALVLHDLAAMHFDNRDEQKPLPRRLPGRSPDEKE